MALQIQLRRDTAANWTSSNPTLAQGEFGFETNTGKFKIGNGSTAWNSLAYSLPALSATSPITYTDGVIAINQGSLSIAASQINNLATGVATFLTTPTSANLAAAVTNETGTGNLVFSNSPTFSASINVVGSSAPNVSIGQVNGTSSSPFIDFNSGAEVVDYDARIITTGGNGVVGNGTLQLLAGSVSIPNLTLGTTTSTVAGRLARTSNTLRLGNGTTTLVFSDDSVMASTYLGINANAVSATTATNLAGGAAGRVPYQSGSGTTAFTDVGTAGQVLTSNGTSAPTWSAPAASGFNAFLLSGM
jgi:hypothetical protein